jgi:hypothetical protein
MFGDDDTLAGMVAEVVSNLRGHVAVSPRYTTLSTSVDADDTTFVVQGADDFATNSPRALTRGVYEIDLEQVYVESANGGTLTVPAWGRGFNGTTPAAHSAGAKVSVLPDYPDSQVAREINRTLTALYPRVYAVDFEDYDSVAWPCIEDLPADCVRVLQVEWRRGEGDQWSIESAWEQAGTTIIFGSAGTSGTYRVLFAKLPATFAALDDEFADTGLRPTMKDAVVLGTTARLLRWIDTPRFLVESAQANSTDQSNPIGGATQASARLAQQYEKLVSAEQADLDSLYPHKIHRIR